MHWLLIIMALWISHTSTKEVRIVCYYTNWSVYRPGSAKFNPQNINPYLCTHLVYAFGGFTKENTLKPFDKYQDIEKGGYAKFVGLKTYNKNLKTLLAIGGWNEGSTRFSPMVANADRRKELVKNVIKFLRQNHFDGLDLDWEYPSFRDGGKQRDKENYAQLVQELREEFDRESEKTGRPRLLLTMAVPAGIEYINKGYDVPKLTKYLDWMNILSYDYHSAYEPAVNHHSPLYPLEEESEYSYDIDLNVDYTIKHYLKAGADKSKLVLGIPTYGRSYTLYNADASEIGAPADGPGEMGEATRENGYLAYYEICESIKSGDWIVETPYPDAMGPYAYKEDQWVGYDDATIATKKAEYVAENGLGGIMFWSIDNDDFRGSCGGKPYPIIEAAKEALLRAYGFRDASLHVTKKPIKSRGKTRTRGTTAVASTTEALPINSKSSDGRQGIRRNPNRVIQNEINKTSQRRRRPTSRASKRRIAAKAESTNTESSLVITPSYTTPAPPSTPDSGGEFKCEDEGFYPHPRDCKKYFWCLSGSADLGIIAHQFNCPAGLYFNKAAASCDYSQNVLCNKKLSSKTTATPATTSTSTSSSTTSSVLSTRRPKPKITAATSRTTYTTSTAAPEYEDEYEEYEEEDDGSKNSEEDPRVIKELLELIKKAGGIEELEKQLKIQDDGSATVLHSASTTPSTISKTLYQRVLGRASSSNTNDNNLNSRGRSTSTYITLNRNSRGPQNAGIEQANEETESSNKGRPQYSTINRQRSSTEGPLTEEEDEEDIAEENVKGKATPENKKRTLFKNSQPEYVTIRRQRITTTTEEAAPDDEKLRLQLKRLGEEGDNDDEGGNEFTRNSFRSSTTPTPYVTIRRTRPATIAQVEDEEESTEGKPFRTREEENDAIDGPTLAPDTTSSTRERPTSSPDTSSSKYVAIRRRPTLVPPIVTTSETVNTDLPETVTTQKQEDKHSAILTDSQGQIVNITQIYSTQSLEENTVGKSDLIGTVTDKTTVNKHGTKNITDNLEVSTRRTEGADDGVIITTQSVSTEQSTEKKRPQLFEPRPFSFNLRTRGTTSTSTTTELPGSQQQNKVSGTSRKTFRNKPFEAPDSFSSVKINNQENNISNDNTDSTRNGFIETKSPTDISDIDDHSNESIDSKIRVRGRGSSRFKLEGTATTTIRSRQRIRLATEEEDSDYETTEYVRKFRPDISSEIADLSSLTAVDLKDSSANRRRKSGLRRQRPRVTVEVTNITLTTTEKPEESLKTSARTLPLARKFLSSTSFGKSRRITKLTTSNSTASPLTDVQNSNNSLSSEQVQSRKISPFKFRRPSVTRYKAPEIKGDNDSEASTNTNNAIVDDDIKLLKLRKNDTTLTTVDYISNFFSTNITSTSRPIRRVIRRFRTTTTTTTTTSQPTNIDILAKAEATNRSDSNVDHINKTIVEDNLNINIISKTDLYDKNENFTAESLIHNLQNNHRDNIDAEKDKNVEENFTDLLINSNSEHQGNLRPNISDLNKTLDDEDVDSRSSEEEEEEGENIKLSESNIRENSQISDFPNGNIIQEIKPGRNILRPFRPRYEGLLNKNDEIAFRPIVRRPVTEPNIIIRTRKIIRKLAPTPTPEANFREINETTNVARRLRPTTLRNDISNTSGQQSDPESSTRSLPKAYLNRRRYGFTKQPIEKSDIEKQLNDEVIFEDPTLKPNKPVFGRRKFGASNLRNSVEKYTNKSQTNSQFSINKSIYSRRKFLTTTTTTESVSLSEDDDYVSEEENVTENTTKDIAESISEKLNTKKFTKEDIVKKTNTTISIEYKSEENEEYSKNRSEFKQLTYGDRYGTSEQLYRNQKLSDYQIDGNKLYQNKLNASKGRYGFNISTLVKPNTSLDDGINHKNQDEIEIQIEQTGATLNDTESNPKVSSNENENGTYVPSTQNSLIEFLAGRKLNLKTTESEEIMTQEDDSSTQTEELNLENVSVSSNKTAEKLKLEGDVTKKLITTTESALSKLYKRRRLGLLINKPESRRNSDDNTLYDKTTHKNGNASIFIESNSNVANGSNSIMSNENNNETFYTSTNSDEESTTENSSDSPTHIASEYFTTNTEDMLSISENQTDTTAEDITETLTQSYRSNRNKISTTDLFNIETTYETDTSHDFITTDDLFTQTSTTDASRATDILESALDRETTIHSTDTSFKFESSNDTTAKQNIITLDESTTNINENKANVATNRKQNRIFRPISSRPKFTLRHRTTENTSPSSLPTPTVSTSRGFKSLRRYNQFRTQAGNRFAITSTTERYDENEELGYGPVKPIKPLLRPNTDSLFERNKFLNKYKGDEYNEDSEYDESEEEYSEDIQNEDNENEDIGSEDLENDSIERSVDAEYNRSNEGNRNTGTLPNRSDLRKRPKPISSLTQTEDIAATDDSEVGYDEIEDAGDNEDEGQKDSNKTNNRIYTSQINRPIGRSKYTSKGATYLSSSSIKPSTRAYRKFSSTTPSLLAQNLTDIDVAAISLRNKNLFNKTRKMNTPFAGVVHITEQTIREAVTEDLKQILNESSKVNIPYPEILYTSSEAPTSTTEFTSYDNEFDLTEPPKTTDIDKSTTLLHVFAETESSVSDTTTVYSETAEDIEDNKKLEKLIEVNRFIKISAKEDKVKNGFGIRENETTLETMPKLDRIGAINRLTEIHVVDGLNNSVANAAGTQNFQIDDKPSINGTTLYAEVNKGATSRRNDRKYEIYGDIKTNLNLNLPISVNTAQVNEIHIDSKSVVTKITPKPFYRSETSTIPLEGLFQTDSPLKYHNSYKTDSLNELLEGENSNYVNVRILEQDDARINRIRIDHSAKLIPIKILKDAEDVTMKADVVEVTPINSNERIKIAPIAVSFQKKIP